MRKHTRATDALSSEYSDVGRSMTSKLKYLIPNAFTAVSMLFGVYAFTLAARGELELAAWMILWGVLLDKLDGTAARLFNATSEFGVQYDSFADFVVFGIAPAALLYFGASSQPSSEIFTVPLVVAGLFIVANSARLARFNVDSGDDDGVFIGIPTTLVGALLASSYLVARNHGWIELWIEWAPIAWIVCAVAMVSNVRLPKLKARKNRAINLFQAANVIAIYLITPFQLYPEYHLGLCLFYLIVGIASQLLKKPSDGEHQIQTA
ncbi:MAG: CDP-diacylglycerol--serine O-phosphatidyltransferase [Bradymonadia bacterium]